MFAKDYANELLKEKFGIKSLKGFGVEHLKLGVISAGAILHYLNETHHNKTSHINSISRIEQERYVWMDHFTVRNLEIFHSNQNGKKLIDVLDKTHSPMGARLLNRWVALPLKDKKEIVNRHIVVEELIKNNQMSSLFAEKFKRIGDLERLISKVSTFRINPRECEKLKESLIDLEPIKEICDNSNIKILNNLGSRMDSCKKISSKIEEYLYPNPPVFISKGNVINTGIDSELDESREIKNNGKKYLNDMLEREILNTGIPSLKISYNNIFGYYFEVRNTHKDKVPQDWIRKQTLVNAERYITEELKIYEQKIFSAEEKISVIEDRIYKNLIESVLEYIEPIQKNSQLLAELDCLLSFSIIAIKNNYSKPVMDNSTNLVIKSGRHPVIEEELKSDYYVPNDLFLNSIEQQIMMITGPNMSGKSALLRQTALIVLMAQIGSFVPANSANIGIVDKIFTRVGGYDNISLGESTFMVEMNETSSILNNLSPNSLILLDEIGRGTSTYDGVSIAWAIAEFLHEHKTKPKTLFATHYHELNEMADKFLRIKNYSVAVKESGKKIIFVRTLKKGGSEHSFGIHVAKMAGMPKKVVNKANQILFQFESLRNKAENKSTIVNDENMQLSFFKLDDPVLEEIRDEIVGIDINSLTPVEALMKLNDIKKIIGK